METNEKTKVDTLLKTQRAKIQQMEQTQEQKEYE